MKKSLTLARALAFVSVRCACWPAARRHRRRKIRGQHPERLPPAPPDRGAREGAVADRLHRRWPRHADADPARRGRRDRGKLAAGSDRRHRDRNAGRRRERARRHQRVTRNPLRPRRGRRARPRHRDPALPHAGSGAARHDPRQLSAHGGRDRPVRAVAARHRPDHRSDLLVEQAALESTAAPASAISPRRSPIRRTWCSRAPKRPCYRLAPHRRRSTNTARARPTATQYPGCQ